MLYRHRDKVSGKVPLSYTRLRGLLTYNKITGIFTWLVDRPGGVKAGAVAGYHRKDGYIGIGIDGQRYLAHVLAWFYHYKGWPIKELDHKNRIGSDNWIKNLRLAKRGKNAHNALTKRENPKLPRGVYKRKSKIGLYSAAIQKDGKSKFLGNYRSADEAHVAYIKASLELYGKFSPYWGPLWGQLNAL